MIRRVCDRWLGRLMMRHAFRSLIGLRLRLMAWRRLGAAIAPSARIGPGVWMRWPARVSVGEGTKIGGSVWLDAGGGISIGRNVIIGNETSVLTVEHDVDSPTLATIRRPVQIGDYVWLPYRVLVLPGTTIGEYGVVGSGSVVRGKVDPYTVVAGNPAKPIRERARADFRYVPSNVPQHRKNIRS